MEGVAGRDVGEVGGVAGGEGEGERPSEERGHLAPGDGLVGAEAGVVGWVAAAGDAGGGECLYVRFVDRPVVVDERPTRWDDGGGGLGLGHHG